MGHSGLFLGTSQQSSSIGEPLVASNDSETEYYCIGFEEAYFFL
jgi:hypothetical protein